jgi:hypothetical protein
MKETHAKKDSERAQDGDGRRTVCNSWGGGGWSWSQKNKATEKNVVPSKNIYSLVTSLFT